MLQELPGPHLMPRHWNCSCRSAGGAEAFLLVPKATSFQSSPSQDSPCPSPISIDSPCSFFAIGGDAGSCTYMILEKTQLPPTYQHEWCQHSLQTSSCIVLLGNTWIIWQCIPTADKATASPPQLPAWPTAEGLETCTFPLELDVTQGLWCTRQSCSIWFLELCHGVVHHCWAHTHRPQQSFWLPSAWIAVQTAASAACLWERCSRLCSYVGLSLVPPERVLDPL